MMQCSLKQNQKRQEKKHSHSIQQVQQWTLFTRFMIVNDVKNGDYNDIGEMGKARGERQCEEAKPSSI